MEWKSCIYIFAVPPFSSVSDECRKSHRKLAYCVEIHTDVFPVTSLMCGVDLKKRTSNVIEYLVGTSDTHLITLSLNG